MLVIAQYTIRLSKSNHPTDGYLQRNVQNLFFTNIKSFIKEYKFPKTALFLGIIGLLLPIICFSLPIKILLLLIIFSSLVITINILLISELSLLLIQQLLVNSLLVIVNLIKYSGKYVLNK